ncbi:hypothetical protein CC80DRAFT_321072 [Byssothecium circinans]|uniref:Uncharacterized protein n=1 Tax=Byssothecium circinans TaxID=147558 RepID=A0A6A5U392_9PLEO|nr:hypothetical protein CC80DRAFT_321072 [Byssothecium circinans]
MRLSEGHSGDILVSRAVFQHAYAENMLRGLCGAESSASPARVGTSSTQNWRAGNVDLPELRCASCRGNLQMSVWLVCTWIGTRSSRHSVEYAKARNLSGRVLHLESETAGSCALLVVWLRLVNSKLTVDSDQTKQQRASTNRKRRKRGV